MRVDHGGFERDERRYDEHRVLTGALVGVFQPATDDVLEHVFESLGELDICANALVGRLTHGSLYITKRVKGKVGSIKKKCTSNSIRFGRRSAPNHYQPF